MRERQRGGVSGRVWGVDSEYWFGLAWFGLAWFGCVDDNEKYGVSPEYLHMKRSQTDSVHVVSMGSNSYCGLPQPGTARLAVGGPIRAGE